MTTNTTLRQRGAGIILTRLENGMVRHLVLRGRGTGVWSFPKGHAECPDSGSPLRTAVRETYEETGYVCGRDYAIIGSKVRYGKRPYWLGIVVPEAANQLRLSWSEHDQAAWLTWEEIQGLGEATNTDIRCWLTKSRGNNSAWSYMMGHVERITQGAATASSEMLQMH